MNAIILASVALRFSASVLAVAVSLRQRDRRILILAAVLFLTGIRQSTQIVRSKTGVLPVSWRIPLDELPGLGVSLLAIPAVFFLGQLIGEHKRALAALRNQQEQVARAESNAWVMTGLAGLDGRWIKPPKRIDELVGESVNWEETQLSDLFVAGELDHFREKWNLVASGDCLSFETEIQLKDSTGQTRWFSLSASPSFNETGRPDCILVHLFDISARRESETEMRRINNLLKTVIETSPLGLVSVDSEGRVQILNRAAEEMFGWSFEEAVGKPVPFIPAESRLEHSKILHATSQGSHARGIELCRMRKDGRPVDVQLWTAALRDSQGRPIGVFGMLDDITERKKTERALKQSEQRLRLLVENLGVIAWEADATNWRFTFVTGEPERITGFTAEEWCEPNFWAEHIHPEDRIGAIAYCKRLSDLGESHDFEYRLLRKDGETIWVHDYVAVEMDEEKPVLLRGLIVDVTAAKKAQLRLLESQESLRTTIEATQVGSWEFEPDSNMLTVSPEWTQQLGYEWGALENPSEDWLEWIHPDDKTAAFDAFHGFVQSDEARFETQVRMRHRDGRYRWILSRGMKFKSPSTGKTIIRGVHIDITSQKATELALLESEQRFRGIAEQGSMGIWEVTADRVTTYVNLAMAQMLEVDSPEAMLGISADEFFTPDNARQIQEQVHQRPAGETQTYEAELITRRGHRRHVIICGVPLRDANGKIYGTLGALTDITKRKRAERDLAESREQFMGIVNSAMDAIITIDEEQRIVLFNAAAESMFKVKSNDVIGESIDDLIPSRFRQEHQSHVRAFRLGAATSRRMGALGAIHGLRAGGEEFPIEASISQMEAGGRHFFTVILRDISERVRADHELRESRGLLQKAQEIGGIGSWWSDPIAEGRVRWSNGTHRIFGLTETEFDQRVESFFEFVHPEDRDRVRGQADAALAGQSRYSFDHRIVRPDGETRWVHQEADIVRDDQGRANQIVGITLDITDRVRAQAAIEEREERFSALVSALSSVVWTADAQGRFISPQASWEAFTGQSWEQHQGWRWTEALHRDDRERVAAIWRAALESGSPYESEGRIWHAPTQSYHFFTTRGVPLKNADGTIREWVGTVTDIDAGRRAEQAVLAAKQALLEQQEMERERVEQELSKVRDQLVLHTRLATIGQVSASIAHELRNPLGAVRNAAYFLRRRTKDLDAKWIQYLSIIEQEVETSDRIISNLMEMTRSKEPEKQSVNLEQTVETIVANIPTPNGIEILTDIQPTPFMMAADPAQLRQVFVNLITNAVQALNQSGEIRIDARRDEDYDSVVVRNSGEAIPREDRSRLFEPLYTTKAKGTGLGLTICRQIVERHGGMIEYLDDGVPGAAFRVLLPRLTS